MGNPGGRIWAARAKKLKAQLDAVRQALVEAGFPVDDADDEGVAKAVVFLAAKVRDQAQQLEDAEWDRAGRAREPDDGPLTETEMRSARGI